MVDEVRGVRVPLELHPIPARPVEVSRLTPTATPRHYHPLTHISAAELRFGHARAFLDPVETLQSFFVSCTTPDRSHCKLISWRPFACANAACTVTSQEACRGTRRSVTRLLNMGVLSSFSSLRHENSKQDQGFSLRLGQCSTQ